MYEYFDKFRAKVAAIVFIGAAGITAFGQSNDRKENVDAQKATGDIRTVDARQSGPWSIGIDQTNNAVRVSNSPADPVAVKVIEGGSARKPFQIMAFTDIGVGGSGRSIQLRVPTGKRLVIENVSGYGYVPKGLKMSIDFLTNFDNGEEIDDVHDFFSNHVVTLFEQAPALGGQGYFFGNHKVLIFADERVKTHSNLPIRVNVSLSEVVTTGFARAVVTFSGYMEDLPPVQ